jgi:hypothetical protein
MAWCESFLVQLPHHWPQAGRRARAAKPYQQIKARRRYGVPNLASFFVDFVPAGVGGGAYDSMHYVTFSTLK